MFKKYFVNGFVEHVGCLGHRQFYKKAGGPDLNFKEYVESHGVVFNYTHEMCSSNLDSEYAGTAKYDRMEPILSNEDEADLNLAFDMAVKHFRCCQQSKVSTLEESIAMSVRSTSAGFPQCLKFKSKGVAIDTIGVDLLSRRWDDIVQLDAIPCVWKSTVKQERRAVEKLRVFPQKLRVFTASPMEHSILLARMCLDMNEKFYNSAGKTTWSFVGTSPFFAGFDTLYKRLNKHPNAFELDESAYDSSIFRKLMIGCFNWRWGCLRIEDRTADNFNRLYVLYRDIVDSYILCGMGDVIKKNLGNPSGSANTIVDNTFVLFWIFSYAFVKLSRGRKRPDGSFYGYDSFVANVEAAMNGDDNTWTASDEVVGWFNAEAVALIWSKLGIITSSGTDSWAASKLDQLKFLSQSFGEIDGIKVPVSDHDKAMCSLLWGNPKSDVRFTLLRAYALRIQTWSNVRTRNEISRFINYLENERGDELVGSYEGISMLDIRSVYKTDADIKWLYLGNESVSDDEPNISDYNNLFMLCDLNY